ncbi:MAG: class I tRNA ligase family protein, partial [Bacteroidales bacterium]|nr:class I tRNA ligase family protein [Bacteroidales bacterium]
AELKVLHRLIGKEKEDIESFSFNTTISAFMIAVNELTALKCTKRAVLEPMVVLLSPFAPHIAEELWQLLGHAESVSFATYPAYVAAFTVEDTVKYPVQFNGKMRFLLELPKSLDRAEVEAAVRADANTAKYLQGAAIRKVIVVPGKIINIVC